MSVSHPKRDAGGLVEVPDASGTRVMVATPTDFDGHPPTPRWRAPGLGEHTREVLTALGLDEQFIQALIDDGVAVAAGAPEAG